MSIFDKLMAVKQVAFTDGEIKLMNQRVMFIPNEVNIALTKVMLENKNLIGKIYQIIKKDFNAGWSKSLKQAYGFDSRKFMEWLINLTNLSGWGINKLENFDATNKTGIFTIQGAPAASYFNGKINEPVDHLLRALYAGGASTVFGEEIDWIEVECQAKGAQKCKLVFGPRKELLEK